MNTTMQLTEYSVEDGKIIRRKGSEETVVANYDEGKGLVEILVPKYRIHAIKHLNDKEYVFNGYYEDNSEIKDGAPPKPKINRRIGDKTPEIVEWYARYQKKAFLVRYGVTELQRRTGFNTITEQVRNEQTGKLVEIDRREPIYEKVSHLNYDVDALQSGEQRLIAERTTDLTVKGEATADNSDEFWG